MDGIGKSLYHLAVAGAGLFLIIFSAYAGIQNRKLQSELKVFRDAREYPYVLRGFFVDLESGTTLERVGGSSPPEANLSEKLLLVSQDSCGPCEDNIQTWARLLEGINWEQREAVFVTFDRGALIQSIITWLSSRHIKYRHFRVVKKVEFMLRTGLNATPYTLVLGETNEVLLAHSGVMSEQTIAAFREFLSTGRLADSKHRRPFIFPEVENRRLSPAHTEH